MGRKTQKKAHKILHLPPGFINALKIKPWGGVPEEHESSAGVQLKTKTYLHLVEVGRFWNKSPDSVPAKEKENTTKYSKTNLDPIAQLYWNGAKNTKKNLCVRQLHWALEGSHGQPKEWDTPIRSEGLASCLAKQTKQSLIAPATPGFDDDSHCCCEVSCSVGLSQMKFTLPGPQSAISAWKDILIWERPSSPGWHISLCNLQMQPWEHQTTK